MSLYFETPIQFTENNVISTNEAWHPVIPRLAVASYSQEKGGFVTVFDELGEPLKDIAYPIHPVSQVTALVWHPELNMLVTGWENGEMKTWIGADKEFNNVAGPHKTPVVLLQFSEKGGRLASCDSSGSVVGWKVDKQGQIMTAFHHDLKETITHLTFRLTVKNHPEFDIAGLAKAAVNGNEQALDMFSNWRPKTTARKVKVQEGTDNNCFFVGTQSGSVYYINENGVCIEVLNTEGVPLSYILYHPSKSSLVVMMEGLTIGHFSVDSQGQLTELTKVKLNGRGQAVRGIGNQGLVWANNSCLAVLTGDLTLRIWDIESNDNYLLPVSLKNSRKEERSQHLNETFYCLSYCKLNQTLCAGTNTGHVYFWAKKLKKQSLYGNPEDTWELLNINRVNGTIKQLTWGSMNLRTPLLTVNCVTKVYIMKEQNLCTCFHEKMWAVQKTGNQVLIETPSANLLFDTEIQITDMSINDSHIAFTNGRTISHYNVFLNTISESAMHEVNFNSNKNCEQTSTILVKPINSFMLNNEGIIVHGKNIIVLTLSNVVIKSSSGTFIASVSTVPSEGEPIGMDVTANFLTIFTMEGYLKIFSLLETGIKLHTPVRNLYDMCNDFGEIIQAKTNCAGNMVALTLAAANLIPDGKLYVWDIDHDQLKHYDLQKVNSNIYDNFDIPANEDDHQQDEAVHDEKQQMFDTICSSHIPLSLYWDSSDARLLLCNAKKLKYSPANPNKTFVSLYDTVPKTSKSANPELKDEDHIIITMFVSSEHEIRIQDIKAIDLDSKLLGIATPYIVFLQKQTIVRDVMSDFGGLQNCNDTIKAAVLDFSYYLSLGNTDAAFKAIKPIQNKRVWNSLAKMCVKTRRLDIAGVCLGHMGNATAARALRIAMADSSLPQEAKLAVLAIQLGMLDEAEQLYLQCEQYDLLNKLYQRRNKMNDALKLAEAKDRIHLKHTHYICGKSYEYAENLKDAISEYEKAGTYVYDVPRLLLEQPLQLEAYMSKTNDAELLKWWGQYKESQGELNEALQTYSKADDIYNQVRTLCFMQEESVAAKLTQTNNDKAAFYHMARHYESANNLEEAVNYFKSAHAYGNAVRICKENNFVEQLWNIGLIAGNREKLECAKYFEDTGLLDKAVVLYQRAGFLHKALDLAFKADQLDILQQIATNLDDNSDPALVQKCADYFISNQQYDRAVNLLAIGKNYKEAISICVNHNVQLTDELVEKLTPTKDELDEQTKHSILETLAESLVLQGNYHLATKKFTQAGDRVRAMKALLKSGDTDKIVFFAGVSRQREIYIMAANYLQSLDWQNQSDILKNIITFYSKGKALDLLANFYVACAQVEIDEFQNYEKAYGALTEASRCLAKITSTTSSSQYQNAVEIIQRRMAAIKKYIDIHKLFERGDLQGGIAQCRQLLVSGGQDLEESVRRGDVYALMIYQYVKKENFVEAKQILAELKQVLSVSGNIPVTYHVNKELLEALAKGLAVSVNTLVPSFVKEKNEEGLQDEIEEEVEN